MSKYQKMLLALKIGHPTLQNMNFLNFFLFLWVIFALLDPDPLTRLNPDPIEIRIRNPAIKRNMFRSPTKIAAVAIKTHEMGR
jgi:hypothetical protein